MDKEQLLSPWTTDPEDTGQFYLTELRPSPQSVVLQTSLTVSRVELKSPLKKQSVEKQGYEGILRSNSCTIKRANSVDFSRRNKCWQLGAGQSRMKVENESRLTLAKKMKMSSSLKMELQRHLANDRLLGQNPEALRMVSFHPIDFGNNKINPSNLLTYRSKRYSSVGKRQIKSKKTTEIDSKRKDGQKGTLLMRQKMQAIIGLTNKISTNRIQINMKRLISNQVKLSPNLKPVCTKMKLHK